MTREELGDVAVALSFAVVLFGILLAGLFL